jgi:hypothetical protein
MLILKWFIQDNLCFSQMSQLATKIKPCIHLGVTFFYLRRVNLVEYILVLRVLFSLLLQMARCTMGIASTVCIPRWATTRTKGMVAPYVLPDAFVGHDSQLAL